MAINRENNVLSAESILNGVIGVIISILIMAAVAAFSDNGFNMADGTTFISGSGNAEFDISGSLDLNVGGDSRLYLGGYQQYTQQVVSPAVLYNDDRISYFKGNYWVIAAKISGTVHYNYINLTNGTWTHSTTAP